MAVVAFQNVFYLKIFQNNIFFYFFKFIFDIIHQNNLKTHKKNIFNTITNKY